MAPDVTLQYVDSEIIKLDRFGVFRRDHVEKKLDEINFKLPQIKPQSKFVFVDHKGNEYSYYFHFVKENTLENNEYPKKLC